eukprot:2356124-Rhodomonas_salina.1
MLLRPPQLHAEAYGPWYRAPRAEACTGSSEAGWRRRLLQRIGVTKDLLSEDGIGAYSGLGSQSI